MLLHVAVHGTKLHLPPEIDVHRALLHRGVDELIRGVPQLQVGGWRLWGVVWKAGGGVGGGLEGGVEG